MQARAFKMWMASIAVATICGCATAPVDNQRPTHRWVTEADVSQARYNFDRTQCRAEAGSGGQAQDVVEGPGVRRSDPEFAAYQLCMEGRGYQLATY